MINCQNQYSNLWDNAFTALSGKASMDENIKIFWLVAQLEDVSGF
jgi:hypothetical protein